MSAYRLVDMVLGDIEQVHVETSFVPNDCFDDLTTIDANGNRERIQLKHTDKLDSPLALSTFTNNARRLRIDRIFASILADRDFGSNESENSTTTYRVVLRDSPPIDSRLTSILVDPQSDPGPFAPGFNTKRYSFDSHRLWGAHFSDGSAQFEDATIFPTLRELPKELTFDVFHRACTRLVIEVDSPPFSGDLFEPGIAERSLLTRVHREVGAGHFPNIHRTPHDVADSLIDVARTARLRKVQISRAEILRRAQLQTDFGAVAHASPVDHSQEISRSSFAKRLTHAAKGVLSKGGRMTVVGPPGHGKSWLCNQMIEDMRKKGWLVADHFCFLGDADEEKGQRVLAERVFGSLVNGLIDADSRLGDGHYPKFAADVEALERILANSHAIDPVRPISLVVDGIDHVTRVLASNSGKFDPSISLAESLADVKLPPNAVLIVLSQPGAHTRPLKNAGAVPFEVDGFDQGEIESLARKMGVISHKSGERRAGYVDPILGDLPVHSLVDAIANRSGGNALYATYICREVKERKDQSIDPLQVISTLPAYKGSLENYYEQLCDSLGHEGGWVADVMALVDFGISRADLCAIQPSLAHRVESALETLAPVLRTRATEGGHVIYHESFARYLRNAFDVDKTAAVELVNKISIWLKEKGLYEDVRTFRSLIPLLSASGRHSEVVEMIGTDFVVRSIESGFPASAINKNLSLAVQSASQVEDWPAIVRYSELCRSAEAFQFEQFDSTITNFVDIPMSLLGPDALVARLINRENAEFPARIGLRLCAVLDSNGAVAPWLQYMRSFVRESKTDNVHYGAESDSAVWLAWFRGRLRLTSSVRSPAQEDSESSSIFRANDPATTSSIYGVGESWEPEDPLAPISWADIAKQIEANKVPVQDVVPIVLDIKGVDGIFELIEHTGDLGDLCLAVARHLDDRKGESTGLDPVDWVDRAICNGVSPGAVHELVELGTPVDRLTKLSIDKSRERLISLTAKIQDRLEATEMELVLQWLDECAIAARRDAPSIEAAEAIVVGDGWHKCWIRYSLGLARAEGSGSDGPGMVEDAFRQLLGESDPFVGDPRACDLFGIHGVIESTVRRGVNLASDSALIRILRLLKRVSDSVTTTLMGSAISPVPMEFVVELAAENKDRVGDAIAQEILSDAIQSHATGQLYPEIARMHLQNARLLLTCTDSESARKAWRDACRLLAGYGFRKDITIFELLDPLTALTDADCGRSRNLLKLMLPLCLRVVNHTDGSETHWALDKWWSSLAKADPLNCAQFASERLLNDCNDANDLLHGALADVWRCWHSDADAVLSAGLRLSIDSSIERSDPDSLARLVAELAMDEPHISGLIAGVLARADERPVAYPYSNGGEILARDDRLVEDLNAIAQCSGLPLVSMVQEIRSMESANQKASGWKPNNPHLELQIPASDSFPFTTGPSGVGQAIRAWSRRPYKPVSPNWNVGRFANAIGYRLLELVESGRTLEAEAALQLLSEYTRFGDQVEIWIQLAEGLERHQLSELAAKCYAVPWIHARRSGGSENVNHLRRATSLDASAVMNQLTAEISSTIANSSGAFATFGLTKSLVYGFAVGALKVCSRQSVDLAFDCWEGAFQVISNRAPRIDEGDDSTIEYEPTGPIGGAIEQQEIDKAIAIGIVASLSHPSREKKRRALLAIRALIANRPQLAGSVLNVAFPRITCAATTTWLLKSIEEGTDSRSSLIAECQESLTQLTTSEYHSVRSVAIRLLRLAHKPVPSPVALQLPAATQGPPVFDPESTSDPDRDQATAGLIDAVAKQRIEHCERFFPGTRQAVHGRVTRALDASSPKKRLREFARQFMSQSAAVDPDAFDVLLETVENQFQLTASDMDWSQLATSTSGIIHPIESDFDLENDATAAVDFESRRVPRPIGDMLPPLRLDLLDLSPEFSSNLRRAANEQNTAGQRRRDQPVEPVEISSACAPIYEPRADWRLVAAVERLKICDRRFRNERVQSAFNVRTLEVRGQSGTTTEGSRSVHLSSIGNWFLESRNLPIDPPHIGAKSMFGIDVQVHQVIDGWRCILKSGAVLAPTPLFRLMLGLEPAAPYVLQDDLGEAAELIQWRAAYEVNNYELSWPRLVGCGVLVRPDLCEKLELLADGDLVLCDRALVLN